MLRNLPGLETEGLGGIFEEGLAFSSERRIIDITDNSVNTMTCCVRRLQPPKGPHELGTDWEIEDEAIKLLERYDWPGNVRQLINALERAKILADDWVIHTRELPHDVIAATSADSTEIAACVDDLSSIERAKIIEILRRENGNKSRAARALGINRRKLYRLVEKYGFET